MTIIQPISYTLIAITLLALPAHAGDDELPMSDEQIAVLTQGAELGEEKDALKLGQEHVKRGEYALAEKWYRFALYKNIGRAALGLYDMHMHEQLTLEHPEKMRDVGMDMIRAGAESGNGSDAVVLAEAYLRGEYVPTDYDKATSWFRIGEARGKPTASYFLGLLYSNGLYLPTSHHKALYHYSKASDGGVAEASRQIGLMYQKGLGVDRNLDKAIAYFEKAASQEDGSVLAMRDLANLYRYDRKDGTKRRKWLAKAAKRGDADAQYYSARYSDGKKATNFYKAAAKQKHHLSRVEVDKAYTK